MSHFIRSGNTYRVAPTEALDIKPLLPAGNYAVKMDERGAFFLEQIESFEKPSKVYGNSNKQRDRIFNTFMTRAASTGVLLTGEKGSGKTMLSKNLSILAAEQGVPTIVVNSAFCGPVFNALIQSIEQPAIVLFDEFEKVYDRDEQEALLTLLDGVYPSKKLFVLTCNDKWRIDSHMRNRPGRIFYMLDFKGLDNEFIVEYCNDNLINKDHTHGVTTVGSCFTEFNFDMLKALVEEMNRYNETAAESMLMLNANPEFSDNAEYNVTLQTADGNVYEKDLLQEPVVAVNPLDTETNYVRFKEVRKKKAAPTTATAIAVNPRRNDFDDDSRWNLLKFEQQHLQTIDPATGTFLYVDEVGNRLKLIRAQKTYTYHSHFGSGDPRV